MSYTDMNYGGYAGNSGTSQMYQFPKMAMPNTQVAGSIPQITPGDAVLNAQVNPVGGNPIAGAGQGGQVPGTTGWQKFGYITDGLAALSQLWGGIQGNKIAKQQLSLAKESYNTNMNNSIKSYNTALEDRIRSRYAMEGRSSAERDDYINEHSLKR